MSKDESRMTFSTENAILKLNAICKILEESPLTVKQMQEKLGYNKNLIFKYTNELRRTNRVHLSCLESSTQKQRPAHVFKIGAGKDCKLTKKIIQRQTIKRKVEKTEIKIKIVPATSHPFIKNTDPLMVAFYGMQ